MNLEPTEIPDVKVLTPRRFGDARGWFAETYNRARYVEAGIAVDFVQDNMAFSAIAGTLRGLHYQAPPAAQDKLVSVARGRVLDVAVDIRKGSPTFGRWVAVELTAVRGETIFVPKGFAHGYCTLEPDCLVTYKVSAFYAPDVDFGIAWNDPDLAIKWPFPVDRITLSAKDKAQPRLKDITTPF